MIKEGTMRPVKKILGWVLMVIGAIHVLNIQQIISILEPYKMAVGLVIVVGGFFLAQSDQSIFQFRGKK